VQRRDFNRALIGAAAALGWPASPGAQGAETPHRIGYLSLGSPAAEATRFDAFRAGLAELGHVEGKNLVIETRWLDGRPYDRLDALAAELVGLELDVIVTYATPGVSAARRASQTIPIVFATIADAVAVGAVASLARPGGNATGSTYFVPELVAKRLEFLKEAIPGIREAGVLFNPANPAAEPVLAALRPAARSLEVTLSEFGARAAAELEPAVAAMAAKPVGGFVIAEDVMLIYNAETAARLALKYRLASCGFPEFAEAGGLAGYGIDFVELWRRAATYVDKILKGAKPAELPVERPTRFLTTVNLKTAKALGLDVPSSLLLRADEVIE
jgi:putative ABC transport system substrate-binding protein